MKYNLLGQLGPEGEVNQDAPQGGPYVFDNPPGQGNNPGIGAPAPVADTGDDDAREGEERSELERLLAGDISGREGFEGGSVGSPPPGTQLEGSDEEDFSSKLEAALGRFGQPNPVDIPEFVPTPNQIESLVPWLAGKGDLLQVYTDAYIETGSGDFAIAAVRQSESYSTFYPGITRDDGSLRMNETQYESTREGFFRILLENGLNPTIFDGLGKVASLIAGDVSVPEFKTRQR